MQEIGKIDEKGRLLIPLSIRRAVGLETGMEVVIAVNKGGALISPIPDTKVYGVRIVMSDVPGSLARIARILSREGFDIIMSESRSLEREKKAEWCLTGKYDKDFSNIINKLRRLDFVYEVERLQQ